MDRVKRWLQLAFWFFLAASVALAAGYLLVLLAEASPSPTPLSFKDKTDIAQVAITALGLGSVVLLWKQLRDTSRWNKLLTYNNFFMSFPEYEASVALREVLKGHNQDHILRDKEAVLPPEVARKLYEGNDPEGSKLCMDRYLDSFEMFCAAVHCGLIEEDYAYKLEGGRVIRNFRRFERYIGLAQESNKRAFAQLKLCANRWIVRRKAEDEKAASGDVIGRMAP